jgi:hypothetical protein
MLIIGPEEYQQISSRSTFVKKQVEKENRSEIFSLFKQLLEGEPADLINKI